LHLAEHNQASVIRGDLTPSVFVNCGHFLLLSMPKYRA
jgi:hypothetical protein